MTPPTAAGALRGAAARPGSMLAAMQAALIDAMRTPADPPVRQDPLTWNHPAHTFALAQTLTAAPATDPARARALLEN